ncbi:hypothetical protein RhiirC2_797264, partial [Rhizophagus irregularis]
ANKTLVQEQANTSIMQSHPQAFYTSRLLNFTSTKLNENLESEMLVSEDLGEYMVNLDH